MTNPRGFADASNARPTTSPALLMSAAKLWSPPSVPRSFIPTPLRQRKACELRLREICEKPTTQPESLIAVA